MKLSEAQKQQIREELEKYILSGLMDRDQRTPILIGSKEGDFFMTNGDYFDRLKKWIELISGKKTEWVAGIDRNETYMGLAFLKNVKTTKYEELVLAKELRFVIELKAIPIKKTGSK